MTTSAADLGPAVAEHVGWLRLRELSPKTISLRLLALDLVVRHACKPVLDITADDLDSWQRACAATLKPRSRYGYNTQLKGFYRWALAEGHVGEDPSVVLVDPKLTRLRAKPISERDLTTALTSVPAVVRVWILLAAYCGLRASEVACLQREDVRDDETPPTLAVFGKGRKRRDVPLHPRALAGLQEYGMPASGPLFPGPDGEPVTGRYLSGTANRHMHRAGVRASFHCCRHRFASRLYRLTRDPILVRDMLGHEYLSSVEIYVDSDKAAAAYDRVSTL
jgi:integrase